MISDIFIFNNLKETVPVNIIFPLIILSYFVTVFSSNFAIESAKRLRVTSDDIINRKFWTVGVILAWSSGIWLATYIAISSHNLQVISYIDPYFAIYSVLLILSGVCISAFLVQKKELKNYQYKIGILLIVILFDLSTFVAIESFRTNVDILYNIYLFFLSFPVLIVGMYMGICMVLHFKGYVKNETVNNFINSLIFAFSICGAIYLKVSSINYIPDVEGVVIDISEYVHLNIAQITMINMGMVLVVSIYRQLLATAFKNVNDLLFKKEKEKSIELNKLYNELEINNEKLKKALDLAETANKAKSEFLANMSHELRTPLNAVIGLGEVLLEDAQDDGNEENIEPLERICQAGKHLLSIINDILDLSKIEANKMEFHIEEISIKSVMNEIFSVTDVLAQQNGNCLKIDIPENDILIKNDAVRFRQVLINIINNSCKFTKDGEIKVSAKEKNIDNKDYIILKISDTGVGIPKKQIGHLFKKFVQADSSTTKKHGGTGLGLVITKHIVEMMGAKINLSSVEGKGTEIEITIPKYVSEKI